MKTRRLIAILLVLLLGFGMILPASAMDLGRIKRGGVTYVEKGDKGSEVKYIQDMLHDLGYLKTADGDYGSATAKAVKAFCKDMGLEGDGSKVTIDMRDKMKDRLENDVDFALAITSDSEGQWKKRSGDQISFRISVKNVSWSKTVRGFELYMYATDVWGDRIYGDTTVYYDTTSKTVKPGKSVYSDYITMPDCSQIDRIYVGIHKIVYTDGTIKTASPIDYWWWQI